MPRFADVLEQERVHELLRGAASRGRLPHAYLFHGSPGVGKTTTAFALAQYVNCLDPGPEEACGVCGSCFKFLHLNHPDLHWIFPMPGKIKGGKRVEEITAARAARSGKDIHRVEYPEAASIPIGRDSETRPGSVFELRHEAGMSASEGKFKVFVVSDADKMRQEAANSLLKVLEEPEPENLLVLCTSNPGAMLDTIVSRCQAVRFRDLTEETIRAQITARTGIDGPAAALAAALAQGSLTRARSLIQYEIDLRDAVEKHERAKERAKEGKGKKKALDEPDLPLDLLAQRDLAVAFLEWPADSSELRAYIDHVGRSRNRSAVRRMIEMAQLWLADLLRVNTGADLPLANADRAKDLRKQAAGLDPRGIARRSRALEQARIAMEGNGYLPLVLHELALALRDDTLVAARR